MSEINDLLLEISTSIARLEERVDNFQHEYKEGKKRAQIASKDHSNHLREIRETVRTKVGKEEIKPLMILNWILSNWSWRVIFFVLVGLSALGLIQVNWAKWKIFGMSGGG